METSKKRCQEGLRLRSNATSLARVYANTPSNTTTSATGRCKAESSLTTSARGEERREASRSAARSAWASFDSCSACASTKSVRSLRGLGAASSARRASKSASLRWVKSKPNSSEAFQAASAAAASAATGAGVARPRSSSPPPATLLSLPQLQSPFSTVAILLAACACLDTVHRSGCAERPSAHSTMAATVLLTTHSRLLQPMPAVLSWARWYRSAAVAKLSEERNRSHGVAAPNAIETVAVSRLRVLCCPPPLTGKSTRGRSQLTPHTAEKHVWCIWAAPFPLKTAASVPPTSLMSRPGISSFCLHVTPPTTSKRSNVGTARIAIMRNLNTR
mmetsp:Transcript_46009/g.92857  ORF Transcript_46009/g.92857 Transcript_46009/m.92857 type:complete len:333 (+) Transcript_46009:883-1881(+)